jgi:hypothetical protein
MTEIQDKRCILSARSLASEVEVLKKVSGPHSLDLIHAKPDVSEILGSAPTVFLSCHFCLFPSSFTLRSPSSPSALLVPLSKQEPGLASEQPQLADIDLSSTDRLGFFCWQFVLLALPIYNRDSVLIRLNTAEISCLS